jgi:hypothetical protein
MPTATGKGANRGDSFMKFFLTSFVMFFGFVFACGQTVADNQNAQTSRHYGRPNGTSVDFPSGLSQDINQAQKGFEVPKQHRVANGDTLWHLAGRYYSNPFQWGKIYNANLNVIKNPDLIHPSDELVIPDVTEQIKPSKPIKHEPPVAVLQKVEEIPQETDVELTSQEKSDALTESPSKAVVETVKTNVTFSREDKILSELSESMPPDQKEWYSMLDTSVVPVTWKEDGVITDMRDDNQSDDSEFGEISFSGQRVTLKMTRNIRVSKGDIFVVYKRGSTVYNEEGKIIGKEIQKSALVEIIKIDKSTVIAKIISANTAVSKWDIVKKK